MPNNIADHSLDSEDLSQAKVLIVDDTPANIDVLRKVLQPEGYKLFVANGGERAIHIAKRALPDLILLDIMMPGMDGFETCRALKADPETKEIPVIFITAKTDTDDLVKGFQEGAVDYITKPFRQEEACARVRTHLQARLLVKQRARLIDDLQATTERFRLLATWSPLGIFQSDQDGNIIYSNQCWYDLWGLPQLEDEEGHNTMSPIHAEAWLEKIIPEEREAVAKLWWKPLEPGEHYSHQFKIERKGQIHWLQLYVTKTPGENAGCVGTLEDISHSKANTEAQLRAKSEMLADMAHELRTPLNAIIGYSELLVEEASETGGKTEDLSKITSTAKYLLELINNILNLSRINAGRMPLHLEETPVSSIINNAIDSIRPLAKKHNNELKLQINEHVDAIYTDSVKLQQILVNLLSNACKFTEQGTISLTFYHVSAADTVDNIDKVYFEIADTGIGMSEKQVSRLFQKYVQATDETSRKYGGTGLGLVLSRELSRLMGGNITVSSELGKGSSFLVELPVRTTSPS